MKYKKISALLVWSLALFGCDSGSYKEKNQRIVIDSMKKQFPIVYDENFTLVDVLKDNDQFIYKYEIKNIEEVKLTSPEFEQSSRTEILELYCSDNKGIAHFKEIFMDGIRYDYYLNNKNVIH
ncbi:MULTISPECIES: hypothetical protein [unclassified Gilliamella]|uniref:hypothetical protein n=1 Tax=unclassified Gilliamella TaxID=2685620 RepID=UPI00226AF7A9|nr:MULTISPECIES: hypothetical protein [unclassified Gilliamella]MCX8574750.1 hypothetical protein [Gilliamella sp. B3831]MCX8576896.1 hypothetical protein [Gilliamella sp. B3815]MCX8590474.1 hypothetical protein [Gilliamella sp. B3812]MCX8604082.1 hypothetical protein [Gilliamella sp. B3823]MCX8605813.1 hypothetical protein [Gilliamella sp. B3825]